VALDQLFGFRTELNEVNLFTLLVGKHFVKVHGALFFVNGHELVGAEVGAERVLSDVPPGRSVHAGG
jgi:hypothetical protein